MEYKLKIQGASSSSTGNMKRIHLKGCLSQESVNRRLQEAVDHPYKLTEDVAEIHVTMDGLQKSLTFTLDTLVKMNCSGDLFKGPAWT